MWALAEEWPADIAPMVAGVMRAKIKGRMLPGIARETAALMQRQPRRMLRSLLSSGAGL